MSPVSTEIEALPCRPSSHSLDIILIKFLTSNLGITIENGTCLLAFCIAICVLLLCVFWLRCQGYISLKLTSQIWGQTQNPRIKDRRILVTAACSEISQVLWGGSEWEWNNVEILTSTEEQRNSQKTLHLTALSTTKTTRKRLGMNPRIRSKKLNIHLLY